MDCGASEVEIIYAEIVRDSGAHWALQVVEGRDADCGGDWGNPVPA
jgi:hypothetical protein